jgi:hypothetical protein
MEMGFSPHCTLSVLMNMLSNLPKQIEQSLLFTLDEALDSRLHQNGATMVLAEWN